MRKWLRLGLCLGLLTVALTCSALAATDGYTTDEKGTVTYNGDGTYTASYSAGTIEGNQYALLVVKGTPGNYSISADTIMYIDQVADENGVSFTFIPKSVPDCVVLLGGEFVQETSPVLLGTLIGQGVAVSGKGSTFWDGATVELGTMSGGSFVALASATFEMSADQKTAEFAFASVSPGTYTLRISKAGYLTFVQSNVEIGDSDVVLPTEYPAYGGDVNQDASVNAADLALLLSDFGATASNPPRNETCDINGDKSVNAADLAVLLSNFGKSEAQIAQ